MSNHDQTKSPVCQRPSVSRENLHRGVRAYRIDCPACGIYFITDHDERLSADECRNNPEKAKQLSALLREQGVRKLPPFWVQWGNETYGELAWDGAIATVKVDELLRRWPRTVPERIDRFLCNIGHASTYAGNEVKVLDSDYAFAFAQHAGEVIFHRTALVDQNYAERTHPTPDDDYIKLLPAGWVRFDELTRGRSNPENEVFVAMWYGGPNRKAEMDEVYLKGLASAIDAAGYKCNRADLHQHNKWVMDEMLGRIAWLHLSWPTSQAIVVESTLKRDLPTVWACRLSIHAGDATLRRPTSTRSR